MRPPMEMRNMLLDIGWKVIFLIKWQRTDCVPVFCSKVQFVRDGFGYLAEKNLKLCEGSAWFLLTDYGKMWGEELYIEEGIDKQKGTKT